MKELFTDHPIAAGLLLAALAFVLNTIRRLVAMDRGMPPDKKLEYTMRRGAMALRKLGRAQRRLHRAQMLRTTQQGRPSTEVTMLLWKASSDAGDARSHLAAVLKQAARYGGSVRALQNLEAYLAIAEEVRGRCRPGLNSGVPLEAQPPVTPPAGVDALIGRCRDRLGEVRTAMEAWTTEVREAERTLARTVDPVILSSGGVFRKPWRPESSAEAAETESVINLRHSLADIKRVQDCLAATQVAIDCALMAPKHGIEVAARRVSDAIDAIERALGDADLILPEALARGESPFDDPRDREQSGALQELCSCLVALETLLRLA